LNELHLIFLGCQVVKNCSLKKQTLVVTIGWLVHRKIINHITKRSKKHFDQQLRKCNRVMLGIPYCITLLNRVLFYFLSLPTR
jgi:hypothetical protein